MRVDLCRMADTPDVALRLVVGAGAEATPPAAAGLASLAGELLAEGAGGRSSVAMAEWIDRLGASFNCRTTYDDAVLTMHTLSDLLPDTLDYLAAVARAPDFAAHEVARVRGLRLDRIRRRFDEPAELASVRLAEAVFGVHPYGVPLHGTLESVEAVGREDLVRFWSAGAAAGTAALVMCGDLDPDAAFEMVAERFGDWTSRDDSGAGAPPPVPRAERAGEVVLVDRPRSRQTELRVGGIGLARGAPGEIKALVMNAILGGLFNSRINLNLREEKGWTYGARTTFVRRRRPGPFVLRTAVDTEATVGAIEEIRSEFAAMRDGAPTPEESELARNALTLALPLQFETNAQVAGRRAELISYGLPGDYWDTYAAEVRSVTPAEVVGAAGRYLDPDGLVYLAVGDVGEFAGRLADTGPVHVVHADTGEVA